MTLIGCQTDDCNIIAARILYLCTYTNSNFPRKISIRIILAVYHWLRRSIFSLVNSKIPKDPAKLTQSPDDRRNRPESFETSPLCFHVIHPPFSCLSTSSDQASTSHPRDRLCIAGYLPYWANNAPTLPPWLIRIPTQRPSACSLSLLTM